MTQTILIFLLIAGACTSALAEDKTPVEIKRLLNTRQYKIDEIDRQFTIALKKQKDAYIRRRDIESAKLIDAMLVDLIDEETIQTTQDLFKDIASKISIYSGPETDDPHHPGGVLIKLSDEEVFHSQRAGCYVFSFSDLGMESKQFFPHVYGDPEKEEDMRQQVFGCIKNIPDQHIIALCIHSAFNPFIRDQAKKASAELGGKVASLNYLQPYACIGYKGLIRGRAIESIGKPDNKEERKYHPAVYEPKK
ncbi:interleukin-like EMT inducer domain-containing protein [Pontiella sulfatireligans]|uniref:ILEI/PANDER domain-containing protein n=1 Tax=Pontiella sulfatireligans TaxID=2750658 RepID=A0A6C2UP73_9BACT|nr:interleukin-like EMT inducer domain-containing protein [Pontiella sulfatireligans]VGO22065.1 hypothetical protein SCARR_04146 [Pontiella sulfatireligans]